MKFHVWVDPALAIRAGNEKFADQFVDIPLESFSDKERDIISSGYLIDSPTAIALNRDRAGAAVPLKASFATADETAVRTMIAERLAPIEARARATQFVSDNFSEMLRRGALALEGSAFASQPTVTFVKRWLVDELGLPEELAVPVSKDVAHTSEIVASAYLLDLAEVTRFRRAGSVGDQYTAAVHCTFGEGLPPYDDMRSALCIEWSRRDKVSGEAREELLGYLRLRNETIAQGLRQQLAKSRSEIQEVVQRHVDAEVARSHELAILEDALREVDRQSPGAMTRERFEAGVLPDGELRAALRKLLFVGLNDLARYKRIAVGDLPAKRRDNVAFRTDELASVSAKTFALAREIAKRMPEASTSVVMHVAHEGANVLEQREAVRVSLKFVGLDLSREYVAA